MRREDFDVILKSWELSDSIHSMLLNWKLNNADLISRYIMLGVDEIPIYFTITKLDDWYKYGLRAVSVSLNNIKHSENISYKVVLEVDIQFLLWPFLCGDFIIRVVSTDYKLKENEKLILTGIKSSSLNITFDDGIDLSLYSSYEHVNIFNMKELLYLEKFNVNHIDSLSLFCYYNYDVEEFLETFSYLLSHDLLSCDADIYLCLIQDIHYPLEMLLKFLDTLEKTSFSFHLKVNRKDTKFFKQTDYNIDILKKYFKTIVFNNKIY